MIHIKFYKGNYQEQLADLHSVLRDYPGCTITIANAGHLKLKHTDEDALVADLIMYGFFVLKKYTD